MGSLYYPDRSRIESIAEEYREACGTIPVDTNVLAAIVEEYVGRPILTRFLQSDIAWCTPKEDHYAIQLSALRTPERVRTDFTHELGHILHTWHIIPKGVPLAKVNLRYRSAESAQEERACEEIGLYLACPKWAVEQFTETYFRNYQLRLFHLPEVREYLRQITAYFQVPRIDMEAQLTNQYGKEPFWQVLQREKRRIQGPRKRTQTR
jgi:Zn-dependent peptidase ImmA (M78 family)